LPAGTIIIGWVGIADGGMIGTAAAPDAPGENSCDVCAETWPPLAQSNTKHSAKQALRHNQAADVARFFAAMPAAVLDSNRGEFKPNVQVCRLQAIMLGACGPARLE
jgi:hypothetical protein